MIVFVLNLKGKILFIYYAWYATFKYIRIVEWWNTANEQVLLQIIISWYEDS